MIFEIILFICVLSRLALPAMVELLIYFNNKNDGKDTL